MSRVERVLLVAASCDGTDVGEALMGYHWARALAERVHVTVLCQRRAGRVPPSQQLPQCEVIEFDEVALPSRYERINAMLKPGYPVFLRRARKWIRNAQAEGRRFDIAHQVTPIALRYPSPLAGSGIPYVIGPLAGSLDTPEAFRVEAGSAPWFTRLRGLDALRIALDPVLRASWQEASAVLGVAPYVEELLAPVGIQRFEIESELGVCEVKTMDRSSRTPGPLRLLHVGRAVRTKGLRDCIRALALLPNDLGVRLDVAGQGEEIAICQQEVRALGLEDRVHFHGQLGRGAVDALYAEADVFLFPSFREPSGSVIYEAMQWGLPIITCDRGGPAYAVTNETGIRVAVDSPAQLATALADAVRRLANDRQLRLCMGRTAQARMREIGLWSEKACRILKLYDSILESSSRNEKETHS